MRNQEKATGCCGLSVRPLTTEASQAVAHMFKALGDPVRLRLMSLIASVEEACVCDLTPAFDLSGPTISHHLKTLRAAGLVDSERRGTWVYYWVKPESLALLSGLLGPALPVSGQQKAPTRGSGGFL